MTLLIGGFTPFSTVDYPGHTAAVIFTQGCPWRCPYCHNPSLQSLEAPSGAPAWEDVVRFLESRRGLLDAVVFSGGEPTAQGTGLHWAVSQIHYLGFKVGLHTAGTFSSSFGKALPFLSWVGLDIKAPSHAYQRVTRAPSPWASASRALGLLEGSGVPFEVRTTYHPAILAEHELLGLAQELAIGGPLDWVIQRFQPNSADPELNASGPAVVSDELLERLRAIAPNLNINVR